MKLKYVSLVLALSTMALASITLNPTTTLSSLKADTVSHSNLQKLMYPGYTGKVYVNYTPTKRIRRDLAEIKAFGFDGAVLTQRYGAVSTRTAQRALREAPKGLVIIAAGPSDANLYIKVPEDQGVCGFNYWKSYWHTRHAVLTSPSPVAAIAVDSWSIAKAGIANCSSLIATMDGSSLKFSAGRAPKPSIDHFEVYITQDRIHLMKLIDLASTATELNLANLSIPSGRYWLVVKEVAIPLYRNDVSNEVIYTR